MDYLSVDESHDSCFNSHAHSKAGVHVLMIEDGLKAGQQKHHWGVEITLPQRSVCVFHKAQQQTRKQTEEEMNALYEEMCWSLKAAVVKLKVYCRVFLWIGRSMFAWINVFLSVNQTLKNWRWMFPQFWLHTWSQYNRCTGFSWRPPLTDRTSHLTGCVPPVNHNPACVPLYPPRNQHVYSGRSAVVISHPPKPNSDVKPKLPVCGYKQRDLCLARLTRAPAARLPVFIPRYGEACFSLLKNICVYLNFA